MEKIKLDKIDISTDSLELIFTNKINEIIDYVKHNELKPDFQDHLKTLEDKVKFIMERGSPLESILYAVRTDNSLQDLYDEENEPKISDIGEIEKHSICKHTPIYSGKCCEECKPTVKDNWRCGKCEIEESGYQSGESIPEHSIHCKKRNEPTDNSEKIEEIMKEYDKHFLSDMFSHKEYKYTLGSWLRDKLRNL